MAFNKLMVMLPLMFAARKLDGEDPDIVFMLRCSYGIIQTCIVLAALYCFMVAKKLGANSTLKDVDIFVPPPPQPLADPNAKIQYTRAKFGEHAVATALKLLGSTVFGICMTVGLHWYKGMIIGLAMQTVMGPLNLFENAFAKALIVGGAGSSSSDEGEDAATAFRKMRLFGEKYRDELTEKDDIIDGDGAKVVLKKEKGKNKAAGASEKPKSFEDLLLDTWDEGAKADIGPLLKAFKKDNINFKTKESGWTPLMIMVAIGAEGSNEAIKKMKSLGASASMTDKEGWNALHWAAFHGSAGGAMALMDVYDGMKLGLHLAKDLEGMTPMDHAVKEKNDDVASFLKSKIEAAIKGEDGIADQSGMRKRK